MSEQQTQRVHEFTDEGIRAAKWMLKTLREGRHNPSFYSAYLDPQNAFIRDYLQNILPASPGLTAPIEPAVYVEQRAFKNRLDAAEYLERRLSRIDASRIIGNAHLWSWLGMFYFEAVAHKDADGYPRLGSADVPFVIDPNSRGRGENRHFAHRLMLAYEIYTRHGNDAWLMLEEPVNSLTHFTDRLVGKPEVFRSKGVIRLAHMLYADPRTRKLKPGVAAGGNNQRPAGGVVRLIDVLDQLYMTYDVYGMTTERLLPLLPPEFAPFLPPT